MHPCRVYVPNFGVLAEAQDRPELLSFGQCEARSNGCTCPLEGVRGPQSEGKTAHPQFEPARHRRANRTPGEIVSRHQLHCAFDRAAQAPQPAQQSALAPTDCRPGALGADHRIGQLDIAAAHLPIGHEHVAVTVIGLTAGISVGRSQSPAAAADRVDQTTKNGSAVIIWQAQPPDGTVGGNPGNRTPIANDAKLGKRRIGLV
jgi:hypothetical protein